MLRRGQKLPTEKGGVVEVACFLASGGQGDVYRAKGERAKDLILKVFRDPGLDLLQRTEKLVHCDIKNLGSAVALPFDRVLQGRMVATVAPFVQGRTLESWLLESEMAGDLQTRLVLALGLVTAVEAFHKIGWTPGDLGSDQFIVRDTPTHSEAHLVDLDSFMAPGLPAPRTMGKPPYFSPEMRSAWLAGKAYPISRESDLYSLGVLLHEILLLRHPTAGHVLDTQPERYHQVMMNGWPDDPLSGQQKVSGEPVGFPVALLEPNTQRILRLSLGTKPNNRPSAGEIKAVLAHALGKVCPCPTCKCSIMPHENLNRCPYPACGVTYGHPRLQGAVVNLLLDRPQMVLGREQLPSAQISRRHLEIRRMGPGVEVRNTGRNVTYYRRGSSWEVLPNDISVPIFVGDHLSVGGLELEVTN